MHQIIGGFIAGTVFGQAARKNVWRPMLRSSIKGGLIVTQQAKELAKRVKAETSEMVAEAKEELEREDLEKSQHNVETQPGSKAEPQVQQPHPGRARKKKA